MKLAISVVILYLGCALAYQKLHPNGFYQQTSDLHAVPQLTEADLEKLARYDPDTDVHYHLFTRLNPTISHPLLTGNAGILTSSNFDPQRRTIFLFHGRNSNILSQYNLVMIPACLESDDVNVIGVDWGLGAGTDLDIPLTLATGRSVANFVNWLMNFTGQSAEQFHFIGHSRGSHLAAISARFVTGVSYVTGLDPSPGFEGTDHIFSPQDGIYTEVIWTGAGGLGTVGLLGHVDFFPNGGSNMPGCGGQEICDHNRAFYYMAESIVTGGFTATECATMEDARAGTCDLPGRMQMGSRYPSPGASGIYYLETNAAPPFSIF